MYLQNLKVIRGYGVYYIIEERANFRHLSFVLRIPYNVVRTTNLLTNNQGWITEIEF